MGKLLLFTPIEQRDGIVEIQNNIFEKETSNHTNLHHVVFRNINFKKQNIP